MATKNIPVGQWSVRPAGTRAFEKAIQQALYVDDWYIGTIDGAIDESSDLPTNKATADHIALCANTHDELLKALESLLCDAVPVACDCRRGTNVVEMTDAEWDMVVVATKQARAAIAKARGE
jgi:hypothetical protein